MQLQRSVVAVVAALAAGWLTQRILLFVVMTILGTVSAPGPQPGSTSTLVVSTVFLGGFVVVAVVVGYVLGRLAPGALAAHIVALCIASLVVGFIVSGSAAFPVGWQYLGYAIQLVLTYLVARRTFGSRHPAGPLVTGATA